MSASVAGLRVFDVVEAGASTKVVVGVGLMNCNRGRADEYLVKKPFVEFGIK